MIQLYKPRIRKDDIEAVTKQLENGELTMGNVVEEFEREFAEYIGAPYCIAVNNMTNGFALLLDFLQPRIASLPTATYVSMANMLKNFGVNISFRDGWYVGQPYEIQTDKYMIVDSAHAIEKDLFKQRPSAYWLFSFHATKPLTTGTGGMIALASESHYNFLKEARDSGRLRTSRGFDYIVHNPGWNFYMNDMQGALGLSQLRHYEKNMEERDECYEEYQKHLKPHQYDRRSRYLYQVWVESVQVFADKMKEKGIQVSKHFDPIHLQPAFRDGKRYENAEQLALHMASIPQYSGMPKEDIEKVAKAVNKLR